MKRLILGLLILSNLAIADATKKYKCEVFAVNYVKVTERQKAGMEIAKGTLTINSLKANFDWGEDSGDFKYSSDDISTLEIYVNEDGIMMISKDRKAMILKGPGFYLNFNCK